MAMLGVLNAGRSARKWGRKTSRQASIIGRFWHVYAIWVSSVLVGWKFVSDQSRPTMLFVAAVLFGVITLTAKHQMRGLDRATIKREAANRSNGGRAELRFAIRLQRKLLWYRLLGRGPFFVLADRKMPTGEAQLDFIVISKAGVFNADTKEWRGRFDVFNGELYYGRNERFEKYGEMVKPRLKGHHAETKALRSVAGTKTPTYSLCAVDTGKRRRVRFFEQKDLDDSKGRHTLTHFRWTCDGVPFMDVRDAPGFIAKMPKVMNRYQAKTLAVKVKKAFPPKR